jgi:hypothetical protein
LDKNSFESKDHILEVGVTYHPKAIELIELQPKLRSAAKGVQA